MTKKIEVELPVISREVAEAIKAADDVQTTLSWCLGGYDYSEEHTPALRSIPTATLLRALVNGYEVEKTSEELAKEKREQAEETLRTRFVYLRRIGAMARAGELRETLNTLGIEIEGVNA